MEVAVKDKKTLTIKNSETPKKPDLRNGMHGSLEINAVDAGQASSTSHSDLEPATPDLGVPEGQVTHE